MLHGYGIYFQTIKFETETFFGFLTYSHLFVQLAD